MFAPQGEEHTLLNYMTVGEVADLAGVTVRSIQYYDQQGILSPSAKGPQNQRLYTPADIKRLQCILTLKYAGLSLAQIKDCLTNGCSLCGNDAYALFAEALRETEDAFSSLLKRYATLRSLAESVRRDGNNEPDWGELANSIEHFRDEGEYFWRLSCIYDEDIAEMQGDASSKDRVVTEWHGLIAEAINNMLDNEPLDSERSQVLARRFMRLRDENACRPVGQGFLLLENTPTSQHPGGALFDDMRQGVNDYLVSLVEHYEALHPEQDVCAVSVTSSCAAGDATGVSAAP